LRFGDWKLTEAVFEACRRERSLVGVIGGEGTKIELIPRLIVTRNEVRLALGILRAASAKLLGKLRRSVTQPRESPVT
jgi:4-aminobutyrate aminotransferase-like enzyme